MLVLLIKKGSFIDVLHYKHIMLDYMKTMNIDSSLRFVLIHYMMTCS